MKKMYLLLCTLFLFSAGSIYAQFSVTTNSGSGLAATYPSLASAITALNAATITSPVVISCPTGNETAPVGGYAITQLGGTAANTITIQGSGAANSIISAFTPQVVGSRTDAIIKVIGGDYITIQGFTLQENAANTVGGAIAAQQMTEFGVALFAASATDGAQNNTIQSNTITLSSATTYQNAIGVFSTTASSSTNGAQAASSIAGTNSNNKFYSNTISGVADGFYFISPAQTAIVFESGNDIGGSGAATGNTITYGIINTAGDLGFTSYSGTTPAGIYFRNVVGNSARFNTINSVATLTLVSGGIFSANGTSPTGVAYTTTFSDNAINITNASTTAVTGIDFGSGLSTGTIACNNNAITINQNSVTTVSAALTGIKANYSSASSNINSNSITINQNFAPTASVSNSSAVTGIMAPGATTGTPTINVLGNTVLVNRATNVAATFTGTLSGAVTGIQATVATTTMNVGTAASGNVITIKETAGGGAGTTAYTSTVTFVNVDAAHATVNVVNNTFNTTGSTIRSTGSLTCVNQNTTVTALVNIKGNTANIDRVATSGTLVSFTTTTSTPSEVADTISNNNITFTNISGTTTITAISSLGGPSSPAANNKSINNNIINISGTHTGTTIGISCSFTNTGFIRNNAVTIISVSPTVTGISTSGTTMTVTGNTLSLGSSTVSPTAMTGLNFSGSGAHIISNNTFTTLNFSGIITGAPVVTGIALSGGTLANVTGNTVTNISVGAATSTATPTVDGILISGGSGVNVFKNKIYGITTAASGVTSVVNGIRISGGGTTNSNNVYNNLIGNLTSPASANPDGIRGISITSTSTSTSPNNIYYNTVYLNASSTGANFGTTGIFHAANSTATTAPLNLRNNIIDNTSTAAGTGLTVAYRRSAGTAGTLGNYASTSNNNDFYAGTPSATNLIYSDGTSSAQTMAAYKTGVFTAGTISPRDAASFSEDPEFQNTNPLSADFLKYKISSAKQIESGATNITSYTDDYSGTVRFGNPGYVACVPAGNAPDVGAWELCGIAADLTGPTITYTALGNTLCLSNRTLSATITDPGNVNATAGTAPRIYFKKATNANALGATNDNTTDGWKYVESTTGSSPFSFTINYSLINGGVSSGDVIQYFVVAQDQVAPPNVGINAGIFNATPSSVALTAGAFPIGGSINSYSLLSGGLSGSVNVGPGETYTTLTAAGGLFAAINAGGLNANVTANITGNITTEDGTNALNTINYGCAGPYTLVIKPTGGSFTVSGTNAAGIIKLNGSDNVTFDGSNNGTTSRDLTITNTNTGTASAVIWLASASATDGATGNTIKNCIITGNASTTTVSCIASGSTSGTSTFALTSNSNNTIQNNLISKAQYGVNLAGPLGGTVLDQNLVIKGNLFGTAAAGDGFSVAGIRLLTQQNALIANNTIQNVTGATATFIEPLFLGDCKSSTVSANSIFNSSYTGTNTAKVYGIYQTTAFFVTAGNPTNNVYVNNLVYGLTSTGVSSVWNVTGINIEGGYGDKFYYNSVSLTGALNASGTGPSAAFSIGNGSVTPVSTCGGFDIRNNIFSMTGSSSGTPVLYAHFTSLANYTGSTINYNDLFVAPGGTATAKIGSINGTDATDLAAWKTATGLEANSISANPNFNGATNLRPQPGSPVVAAGTPVAGITTDFTGTARSNSTPTIGAYEAVGDAVPPVITYTPFTSSCSTGNRTLNAFITDATGVQLSAGLSPRIYYRKNGGAYFSSPGSLGTGTAFSATWNFTIIAADMGGVTASDVITYFVIAQDAVVPANVGSNPSAGLVASDVNTVTTPPTTPNSYTIQGPLAPGTYTVGVGGAYTTLTAAVNAYNNSCLSGAVIFSLTDATYPTETFPIIISNPNGNSVNTLTIMPGSGHGSTVFSGAQASGALIKVLSNYVTIDGSINGTTSRDLTISNTSTTSPGVIQVGSTGLTPITNVTLKNTVIINGVNTSSAVVISDGTTLGTAGYFNNISISNNSIQKAYIGIFSIAVVGAGNGNGLNISNNDLSTTGANALRLAGIYAQGVDGATISGNTIGNFDATIDESDKGIWLATSTVNTTVSGNNVTTLGNTFSGGASSPIGIYVSGGTAAAGISVTGNTVTGLSSVTTGTVSGIALAGATSGVTITKNKISNIKNSNTSGYGANGILLSSTSTTANTAVSNNFVSDIAGNGYSGGAGVADNGYGIIVSSGAGYSINNNTVLMNTNQTVSGLPAAFNVTSGVTAAGAISMKNNIFVSTQTLGTERYAIYSGASNTVFSGIDYNIYSTAGPDLGFIVSNRANIVAWRLGTGKDTASMSAVVPFVAATDLHIDVTSPDSWNVNGRGIALASVATDIDGNSRSMIVGTPTDIGADEFTTATTPNDATASAAPAVSTTTTYVSAGRKIADITWGAGGTPPTFISFKYYPGVPPPGSSFTSINSFSNVAATGGSGFTYSIKYYYTDAEGNGIPDVSLSGQKNDLGTWYATGGTPAIDIDGKFVNITGLNGFSLFSLKAAGPLPVRLISFAGTRKPASVDLNWQVSEQQGIMKYVVERSADGRSFTDIGYATANMVQNTYGFTDVQPLQGNNFYRLRIVENSRVSFSSVVLINYNGKETFVIFPLPAQNQITIQTSKQSLMNTEAVISNVEGKTILRFILSQSVQSINIGSLAQGIYFLRTVDGVTSRIVKQ